MTNRRPARNCWRWRMPLHSNRGLHTDKAGQSRGVPPVWDLPSADGAGRVLRWNGPYFFADDGRNGNTGAHSFAAAGRCGYSGAQGCGYGNRAAASNAYVAAIADAVARAACEGNRDRSARAGTFAVAHAIVRGNRHRHAGPPCALRAA